MLKTQERKCRILKIIPHDLKGNHCEIITFMCLGMLSNVATKKVTVSVYEDVFCIIKGVQMGDVDVSDELSSNRNKREDDLRVLTMSEIPAPPPPIDSGKHGYV
jgi:hypothetical protein